MKNLKEKKETKSRDDKIKKVAFPDNVIKYKNVYFCKDKSQRFFLLFINARSSV